MSHVYPLMLDVRERLVVIVGGGGVAARKATGLLAAGATRVRAVALAFLAEFPAAVEQVAEAYAERHLDGAGLVFAATDAPPVNAAIVRDARRHGVLVCRADADDEDPGDFSTPAMLRDGPITITVSAGGSPALAAVVRDALRERLDPAWRQMAEAMATLRPRVRGSGLSAGQRREVYRALAGPEAFAALRGGGLQQWVAARWPELV